MAFWRKKEVRSNGTEQVIDSSSIGSKLLKALLGGNVQLTKDQIWEIPGVHSCISLISDKIASLPIKLYEKSEGEVKEITGDKRVQLLNGNTGDTINATEMRREWIKDYFLGKGSYTYIERNPFGDIISLRYVSEERVSISSNSDPIFKEYSIIVGGNTYYPHDFLKILRNSNGYGKGTSINEENNLLFSIAYNTMKFENALVKKGGNKRGFLKAKHKLDKEALEAIRKAWSELYSNSDNNDNVIILNDGLDFSESSITSVEMQLNENKQSNRNEIYSVFVTPAAVVDGRADANTQASWIKNCIIPLLNIIEAALDNDLLLEREKDRRYFAFDTGELTRGDFASRMSGYAIAVDHNIMGIDEVRAREDLKPRGFNFMKLGLEDVLLDLNTNRIYTPNTNQFRDLGEVLGKGIESIPNEDSDVRAYGEFRYNPYHDPKNGRFTSGSGNNLSGVDFSKKVSYNEHKKDIQYLENAKEYSLRINGVSAYDGSKARNVTCHAARRMHERNVSYEKVEDTVKNADISYPSVKHKNAKVIRKNGTQVVYSDNGAIITVINLEKE